VSVFARILSGFLLLLAGGLLFLLIPLFARVERQYLEAAEEPMVDEANIFAALVEQSIGESGALDFTSIRRAFAEAQARRIDAQIYNLKKTTVSTNLYVTDRHGVVLFDSNRGQAEGKHYGVMRDVGYTLIGQYGARSTLMPEGGANNYVMFVGAPIRRDGKIIGMVSVSKPQRSMYTFISETRAHILSLGGAIFLMVAVGAALITTLYSRPIQRLAVYARAIARGERVSPPRVDSPEVAMLARAFEEMRDALEGRKYVETYVQTLTHEMKSPVAAIRGAAELMREEVPPEQRERFLSNIEAESHRLQQIIDRLLGLSAIESRKALEKPEPVPLADLAEAVADQLRPAAEARDLRIEIAAEIRPILTAESFLIEIAMANLIQNALDFSPPGGLIRVAFAEAPRNRGIEISVDDEGPGIPDYALPRVFERFYSLTHPSTGRKSSGLGLCFVREAVELHGGSVAIANRKDRSGAHAVIRLPLNGAPGKAR
jgi:two-component system sensor histidine kinase CreC